MYLLEYDESGNIYQIIVNPMWGLGGVYVDKLPIDLEDLIEYDRVEKVEENKYRIKGVK